MKKFFFFLLRRCACLTAVLAMAMSCDYLMLDSEGDESVVSTGELEISFNSSYFDGFTKASLPDTNKFILTVKGPSGETVYNGYYGSAPSSILAAEGKYSIDIVSRTFTEPLFDAPQYGDSQVAEVKAGQKTTVLLDCVQLNAGIKLQMDSNFLTAYPSSALLLKAEGKSLLYSYSEKRIAYFKPGPVSLVMSTNNTDKTLFTRNVTAQQILCLKVSTGTISASSSGTSVNVLLDTTRTWMSEEYVIGEGSKGTEPANAMSVSQARSNAGKTDVWVYGYIVGGDLTSSKCSFEAPFSSKTNIVLASKSSCKDKSQCLSVQLTQGEIRDGLNLVDHPDYLGRQVFIKGDIVEAYYGIPGVQAIQEYQLK